MENLICLNRFFTKSIQPETIPYEICTTLPSNSSNFLEKTIQLFETLPTLPSSLQVNLCSTFTQLELAANNTFQTDLLTNLTLLPTNDISQQSSPANTPTTLLQLFLTFLHIAFIIPLRTLSTLFHTLLQENNNLQPYLLLTIFLLLFVLLRHRLLFWRRRGLPFESLSAHLSYFSSKRPLPLDDLNRVRRNGRLFGSFHLFTPVLCIADHQIIEQVLLTKSDCFSVQKTWQLEGHTLRQSIFSNSKSNLTTNDINQWKRKKELLLTSFLSRKIKLLGPTVDNLSSQLISYIKSQQKRKNKNKTSFQTTLDSFTTPFLVYSLCTLVLDLDLPPYRRFNDNENSTPLLKSCRQYLESNRTLKQSALFQLLSPYLPNRHQHLLSKNHKKALTKLLTDAIEYRFANGLIGLPEEVGSKRPSKRRSVKFREKLVEYRSCTPQPPEVAQGESKQQSSARPSSPKEPTQAKKELKELTFIDILLDYEIEPEDKLDKGTKTALNCDEIIENLLAFFTVSLSTLSSALSTVLYYLALHPNEQTIVRNEVIDCLCEGNPNRTQSTHISWECLRRLKYTEAAIKEALRLTSPVERLERVVTKKCTLDTGKGLIELPVGTLVHILVSPVHRDAEYYPQPETFNPKRFYFCPNNEVQKSKENGLMSKYLAFGMGAKSCIGFKFTMFYLKHLVANILAEYEVKLTDRSWYKWGKLPQKQNPLSSLAIANKQIELLPLDVKQTTISK